MILTTRDGFFKQANMISLNTFGINIQFNDIVYKSITFSVLNSIKLCTKSKASFLMIMPKAKP